MARQPELRDALVTLEGPLGAGKTSFVRHLLRALGVQGRVKSPSYTIVEPYTVAPGAWPATEGTLPLDSLPLDIWHFDFYRFDDPQEWEDAGFRELFASHGLKLCEWPRKAEGLLPAPDLRLEIDILDDTSRSVRYTALSPRGFSLLPA